MIDFDYITHIALGLMFGYGLDYLILDFTFKEMLFYYAFIVVGSVIPDVDTPHSFLGKKIRPISDIIYKTLGHRSATHSIVIITIAFFVSVLIWNINTLLVGLTLGALIHVFGDLMTVQGVCIAWPVTKKRYKLLK